MRHRHVAATAALTEATLRGNSGGSLIFSSGISKLISRVESVLFTYGYVLRTTSFSFGQGDPSCLLRLIAILAYWTYFLHQIHCCKYVTNKLIIINSTTD